ncbi:uncharacterized protein N7496_004668 [Penicillium cataractarum]|uniref:Uncharacterized protein n=1 Tax=Penicillium cataractarum TaxID=2100454 RepID=A0A9W9VDZ8_9EURO|nr:uncharacterized protein N7496_004668 [Penicillium cataractarum]KAJ5377259.1 hypothetical protein N7496_004668 [Penicillium cataractarum]
MADLLMKSSRPSSDTERGCGRYGLLTTVTLTRSYRNAPCDSVYLSERAAAALGETVPCDVLVIRVQPYLAQAHPRGGAVVQKERVDVRLVGRAHVTSQYGGAAVDDVNARESASAVKECLRVRGQIAHHADPIGGRHAACQTLPSVAVREGGSVRLEQDDLGPVEYAGGIGRERGANICDRRQDIEPVGGEVATFRAHRRDAPGAVRVDQRGARTGAGIGQGWGKGQLNDLDGLGEGRRRICCADRPSAGEAVENAQGNRKDLQEGRHPLSAIGTDVSTESCWFLQEEGS